MKVLRLKDTIWSQNFIFKGKKTANIYCTLKKKKDLKLLRDLKIFISHTDVNRYFIFVLFGPGVPACH